MKHCANWPNRSAHMALSSRWLSPRYAARRLENVGDQRALLKRILEEGLSVRQAESYASEDERTPQRREVQAESKPRDPQARHLEEQFRRALGTKVTLQRHRSGGGRLI